MPEQLHELAGPAQRLGVSGGHDVHHPGPAAVRLGAAEPGHVHILAGDAANHVGAGDEDAALLGQDHQVGQRGTVGGTASGSTEHHGDLRHLPRRPGHGREHEADRVQAFHALEDAGAAGVPQPDDRRAGLQRAVIGGDDDLAALDAHRAALEPRVAGERDGLDPVDAAGSGKHAAFVGRQQQFQRAGVEERLKARLRVALDAGLSRRGGRDLAVLCWCSPVRFHDGHVDLLGGNGSILLGGHAGHARE